MNNLTGQEYLSMLKSRRSQPELLSKINDLAVFLVLEGPTQPFWVYEFVLAGSIPFFLEKIETFSLQPS